MFQEHERAVLTIDLPEHRLVAGDVGTVVHVYPDGAAYEVEFFTLDGQTLAVVTLEAAQIRRGTGRDILHARKLSG